MNRPLNKVALVTGSGRRLGRQIALAFGWAGYDVAVHYNRSQRGAIEAVDKLQAMGVRAVAFRADISRKSDITTMISGIKRDFGRLDVLVNNAAVFLGSPMERTTEQLWDRTFAINLKGTFFCAQAAAPLLRKSGNGRIINIASLGGLQAWKQHIPYSVSKAGVIHLTRILAKALAPQITVNAVAPGSIIIDGEEAEDQQHLPLQRIPMGRYGEPGDISSMVLFLSQTTDYVTGQCFAVDGGVSI